MRKGLIIAAGSILAASALGFAAVSGGVVPLPSHATQPNEAASDPREAPPLVIVAPARPASAAERAFTGLVSARVQSDLAFRVAGKVTARLVDVGQAVRKGDTLARLDEKDLSLALAARRNAVLGARAAAVQAEADEVRYRQLLAQGWVSRQRYEAARAAQDTARANLAAAEAQAQVAGNEADYAVLRADADGVVMQVLAEPGYVVSAGQPVIRLAQAGPREAAVNLPEDFRPALGTPAQAIVYGSPDRGAPTPTPARLRQLSDAADPASRTYEARFVLDGDAAQAPLGSTVTLRVATAPAAGRAEVPLGALRDDGRTTGVWVLDPARSVVNFRPVRVRRIGAEAAMVEGVAIGERVAALGAHLLHEGEAVRVASQEASR
ncbi:efflux RND transporter periplasmic adaptor subunit [Roseomonas chloroacetimidivorans]|jgi:RND family efflux transporter MFP subunit|uniref:efflux RND transporter periplasmic adaptor subunit n=1 Tax=Roseomonas chloroacetimidivorans TaxID=1766656 RepID=UPI003C71F642